MRLTAGALSLPAGDGEKGAVIGFTLDRPADRAAAVAGAAVSTDTMVTVANAATLRADDLAAGQRTRASEERRTFRRASEWVCSGTGRLREKG